MSTKTRLPLRFPPIAGLCAVMCLLASSAQGRVLDDFNDNTKTAWTDFRLTPAEYDAMQPIAEQGGMMQFGIAGELTVAINSPLFTASTKTSELFTLQEGRTVEFRVDIVQGGGDRSYACVAFIPTTSSNPGELKGYTMAKSPTDVLLVKGINQYFVDYDQARLKQDNVTLVLQLTVKNGSVIIHGEVLDKDDNNKIIWQDTRVDTPAEDPMQTGTDSPAAPYLGTGNFVLLLYANYEGAATAEFPFMAVFDNAEVFVTESTVLDNFDDNTKTGWEDFSFVSGFGLPVEQNGEFKFEMAGEVVGGVIKQQIFSASTKLSPLVEVKEGERIEFRVDVISGGAKDSFAILGFIPTSAGGPAQLQGYSFAKSTTDVLLVKGLGQYFVADDGPTAELKQTNITLVLSLTTRSGAVTIDGKILDKDASDAVIWQRRVVDSAAADIMEGGTDNPSAPYIGTGNFVLMLFADYDAGAVEYPYLAVYDNAVVAKTPEVANAPPIITDILPADRANFLATPVQISFKVTDDQALSNDKISIDLNGTNYTTANGLVVSGTGTSRNVSLGGLGADLNYVATLRAEDSNGAVTTKNLYFDTFLTTRLQIEIEDYNFSTNDFSDPPITSSGLFIDDPIPVAEFNYDERAYSIRQGTPDIDYMDTRPAAAGEGNNPYRQFDRVRAARTRDNSRAKYVAAGGASMNVYDYDVGDLAAGEWLNYTRTFPAGSYEVYLRVAVANFQNTESVLEQVTSDPTQGNQTTQILGSFLGTLSGFTYRNFPLTDASGLNKVVLRFSGKTTLRLRHVTADTDDAQRLLNYLIFIPVADTGVQRATVSNVSPAANSTVKTVSPIIQATIENRDTTVNVNTVKLQVDGLQVNATVTPTTTGATLSYALPDPLPAPNSLIQANVSFKDSEDVDVSSVWSFTLTYNLVDPALVVAGTGKDRGFNVRVVQAELGQQTENSLTFAENLLSPSTTYIKFYDTNVVAQLINFSQDGPGSADGTFNNDELIPGLETSYSTDDVAMEATAYLELSAGKHQLGAHCDDGYKVQVVPSFTARDAAALAFHNGGPANETYELLVTKAGLYRFRMVWYERGGGAHVEWFQGSFTGGPRLLLNSGTAGVVKAFTTYDAPVQFNPPTMQGSTLTITWSGTGVLEESSNLSTWAPVSPQPPGNSYTVTVGTAAGAKLYRVKQ